MSKKKMHFEISERKMILHFFDVFFVFISLYFVGTLFSEKYLRDIVSNIYCSVVLGLYINVFGAVFEMYNLQVASNEFQILKSTILTVSTTVLVYLLTPFISPELPFNRLQIVLFYLIVLGVLVLWRLFYVRFLASKRFAQSALLICEESQVEELILGLESIDPHYKIVAYVGSDIDDNSFCDIQKYIENVKKNDLITFIKAHPISEIVIASQSTDGITPELYHQLIVLLESGMLIREYTQVYESKTQRIPVQYISRDFYRFFPFSRSNQNKLYLSVIRIIELILSIVGLFIGLLILPIIVLGNLLANKGRLFYTQERIGKNGKVFKIYKLRTMIKNAETNNPVFASTNDSRITLFGKFLRKTRIDEIPQFINVLKGDMGIIGPRPERPQIVKEIASRMPFYETRHIIKPGLTGWAQVNYSYGENIEDSLIKLQYDLYYIKHRSFYLDLDITIKTITTILFYRGQ